MTTVAKDEEVTLWRRRTAADWWGSSIAAQWRMAAAGYGRHFLLPWSDSAAAYAHGLPGYVRVRVRARENELHSGLNYDLDFYKGLSSSCKQTWSHDLM